MPAMKASILIFTRLSQLLCTCVAFSFVIHGGKLGTERHLFLACWTISFAGTVVLCFVDLVMQWFKMEKIAPIFQANFPVTFAGFAFLLCLSATIGFPLVYLRTSQQEEGARDHRIASVIFSFLATVAYLVEVVYLTKKEESERKYYLTTIPGKLKVSEFFVACSIFALISDPSSYDRYFALKWCVVVYSFCFILSDIVSLTNIFELSWSSGFAKPYSIVAVVLYLTATAIWPIYQFDSRYTYNTVRPTNCVETESCLWDKKVAVAVFTALNLLFYLADAVITYSPKCNAENRTDSVEQAENQPRNRELENLARTEPVDIAQ